MWPNWLPGRVTTAPVPRSPRSRRFSCSSFKDIVDLCREDPELEIRPDSPRSPSVCHRVGSHRGGFSPSSPPPPPPPTPSVVIYFTSLRVVRKTFEDCRAVRSILRGLRVPIDERDLAMDASLVGDLQRLTGRRRLALPCVFVGGRMIGGAEEVKRLHESGELRAIVGRSGRGGSNSSSAWGGARECGQCGGLRYVMCEQCDGSRRIYQKGLSGFRTCTACNLNGLIKCPSCSPSVDLDAAYPNPDSSGPNK